MHIYEVLQLPLPFTVTARVSLNGSVSVVRTTVFADTLTQARAMANKIFGKENLVSIKTQGMK
jgi:hypothetical protein